MCYLPIFVKVSSYITVICVLFLNKVISLQTNTFQSVVATDGESSFVLLLYADNLIQWMAGDSDGGLNGFGGDRADVGFVGDDSSNNFFLPASNTSAVLNLDETTNTGVGGVWLFRMNNSVERPRECLLHILCFVHAFNPTFSLSGG